MSKLKISLIGVVFVSLVFLLLGVLWVFFPKKSLLATANPYPEPDEKIKSLSPNPEAFCAQWFMLSDDLPPEKKKAEEERYKNCVDARKSPFPPVKAYQTPMYTVEPTRIANLPRRKAGDGTIVETSLAPFPSYLAFYNQWYIETNGKITRVFAGARRGDGAVPFDRPWKGLVFVEVTSSDKTQAYPAEGGFYETPEKPGYLRIIDARGQMLTLLAENGQVYTFDVSTRQYLKSEKDFVYTRKAGDGVLIENNATELRTDSMVIYNQWYVDKDGQRITVLAGQDDAGTGLVSVIATSLDEQKVFSHENYLTPIGPLRIFDAQNERLTLISGEYIFVFDVAARKFVVWPEFSPDFQFVLKTATPTIAVPTPSRIFTTPIPTITVLPYP